MQRFASVIFNIYCRLFNKLVITGRENIPADGALIIYANHVSMFDIFLLTITFRRPIYFMAKKSLFETPVVKWFVRAYKAFPVDRDKTDLSAVMKAMSVLKKGDQLGIFPEGTRIRNGKTSSAKGGVAMFALRCHADLVPVKLTYKRKINIFNRFDVTVGKVIRYTDIPAENKDADGYAKAGEWLMDKVYEL